MKRKLFARLLAVVLAAESVFQCVGALPVHAAGEIPIDESHFPDAEFRKIMSQKYDRDHDGYLDEKERGVYNVVCEGNKNVKSMEGIEYFPDVRGIWCMDCDLAELDLSRNKEVVGVWCSGNPRITSLSFRENKNLEWVYCHDCNLTSLDVTQNEKLAYLEVNTNEHLGKLDVTHNPALEHLTCGTCGLDELDLTHNTILTHLDAFQNNFTELDLSNNRELKRLDIWYNQNLGNIDVSIFPDLEFYNCAYNGVTELDVTKNESLMMLICSGNPDLKKLDLTHNHRLAWLRCMSTSVSELDISQCPQLYFCQVCHNPRMTSLDISNNSRLQKILQDGHIDYSEYDGKNYDWVIDYGGSTDYMDDLRYWFIVDDASCTVTGKATGAVGNGDPDYYDCYINTNDGASGDLVTRGEAIQTLYDLAGRPGYNGSGASRFDDIDGEFYEAAAIWGAEQQIALGYPNVYSDSFAGDKPIAKQDLALMVHRYALAYGYDSAYDYGRTDHFEDSMDIDFYAWGAFTYAIQWQVVPTKGDYIYPHGRMTTAEFEEGLKNFTDHVDIGRTVSVCTSGDSGTLTAQDQNSRHYKNHSESFGDTEPSEPSGPSPEPEKPSDTPTPTAEPEKPVDNPTPAPENPADNPTPTSDRPTRPAPSGEGTMKQGTDGDFYYYHGDSIAEDINGFVDYDGSKFFLVKGKVDKNANGLVQDLIYKEDWYFCANGQVQTQYTGLAEYDGEWFYVKQGKLDTTLAAYVEYDGGLFLVGAGRIMNEVNGLVQDPNGSDWYYCANGQAQTQYTGLAQYDGEWFYVVRGKLASDYSGWVRYSGSSFYVEKGMVR